MGSSRARVKSRLRYGMYSRIAGTGAVSALTGSQMRAARRHPSDIGIHEFSITRTAWGNRWMFFIRGSSEHYTRADDSREPSSELTVNGRKSFEQKSVKQDASQRAAMIYARARASSNRACIFRNLTRLLWCWIGSVGKARRVVPGL